MNDYSPITNSTVFIHDIGSQKNSSSTVKLAPIVTRKLSATNFKPLNITYQYQRNSNATTRLLVPDVGRCDKDKDMEELRMLDMTVERNEVDATPMADDGSQIDLKNSIGGYEFYAQAQVMEKTSYEWFKTFYNMVRATLVLRQLRAGILLSW